jgi:hypothetical protein
MWPTQRTDTDASQYETELGYAVGAVLKIAKELVAHDQLQQRSAVFALLLAGIAASSAKDKIAALDLLRAFESDSLGSNTRATRIVLETVYQRQNESRNRGLTVGIDWPEVAKELGYHDLVNFGF